MLTEDYKAKKCEVLNMNRIFGWAMEYLYYNGQKNTHEIADFIKEEKSKFGVAPRKLVNIMGKDKRIFVDVGKEHIDTDYASYDVVIWDVNRKVVDETMIRELQAERCRCRQKKEVNKPYPEAMDYHT